MRSCLRKRDWGGGMERREGGEEYLQSREYCLTETLGDSHHTRNMIDVHLKEEVLKKEEKEDTHLVEFID